MRKLVTAGNLAGLVGLVFVLLGLAGFLPGLVQEYDELHWWRNASGAELFGVFQTSILLNLLHLGFGAAGLVAARSESTARVYVGGGGVLCFALGIHGLLIDRLGDSNIVPLDRADVWLHVGIGVAMVHAGLAAALTGLRPAAAS